MALDIMDDQKVLVFREGSNVFEGLWGERPEEYDRFGGASPVF